MNDYSDWMNYYESLFTEENNSKKPVIHSWRIHSMPDQLVPDRISIAATSCGLQTVPHFSNIPPSDIARSKFSIQRNLNESSASSEAQPTPKIQSTVSEFQREKLIPVLDKGTRTQCILTHAQEFSAVGQVTIQKERPITTAQNEPVSQCSKLTVIDLDTATEKSLNPSQLVTRHVKLCIACMWPPVLATERTLKYVYQFFNEMGFFTRWPIELRVESCAAGTVEPLLGTVGVCLLPNTLINRCITPSVDLDPNTPPSTSLCSNEKHLVLQPLRATAGLFSRCSTSGTDRKANVDVDMITQTLGSTITMSKTVPHSFRIRALGAEESILMPFRSLLTTKNDINLIKSFEYPAPGAVVLPSNMASKPVQSSVLKLCFEFQLVEAGGGAFRTPETSSPPIVVHLESLKPLRNFRHQSLSALHNLVTLQPNVQGTSNTSILPAYGVRPNGWNAGHITPIRASSSGRQVRDLHALLLEGLSELARTGVNLTLKVNIDSERQPSFVVRFYNTVTTTTRDLVTPHQQRCHLVASPIMQEVRHPSTCNNLVVQPQPAWACLPPRKRLFQTNVNIDATLCQHHVKLRDDNVGGSAIYLKQQGEPTKIPPVDRTDNHMTLEAPNQEVKKARLEVVTTKPEIRTETKKQFPRGSKRMRLGLSKKQKLVPLHPNFKFKIY